MPDNVGINTGSSATVRTDDLAGAHVQYMKLMDGTDGSSTVIAGDASGLDVDTELPAAALFNFNRVNEAAPQVVAQVAGVNGPSLFPVVAFNGAVDLANTSGSHGLLVDSRRYAFDNVNTWEKQRGNFNKQLLISAARTATTNSPDQISHNARGVVLLLDVTVNPGGVETLTVSIEAKLGGVYRAITAFAATAVATNATYVYLLYPGIVETSAVGNVEVQGLVLSRDWRAKVTHSAAGSWTYALESSLIL